MTNYFLNTTPPKGTYLFGGLGTDGTYADRMVDALTAAGISNTYHGDIWPWRFSKTMRALSTLIDVLWGVSQLRSFDGNHDIDRYNFLSNGTQFNLIGYSYGGLIVCQLARKLVQEPDAVIDNLVLLGAPISSHQLSWIMQEERIKNIQILNLTELGDPIFAGIPFSRLFFAPLKLCIQCLRKSGHFIYTKHGVKGDLARQHLAEKLSQLGLT